MTPSEKDIKFDRQLRLWGPVGQKSLENSHIALIGATPVGSELLKDLILPNIGKFTIIDGGNVTEEDISANFFVGSDSLGKPRAQEVKELLNELNEDVIGNHINQDAESLLNYPVSFWQKFNVVIASSKNPSFLDQLSTILFPLNIPLVILESMSFYAYMLIIVKEHTIIETHPVSLVDLRLNKPWPALLSFVDQYDLDSLDDVDLAHVPYIVLLLKFLKSWKESHSGLPPTKRELKEFKAMILSYRKSTDHVNFDEAIAAAGHLFAPYFNSSNFWILVSSLKDFIELPQSGGCLPLTGVLPDMTADTECYIRMQEIYREKAKADIDLFTKILHSNLTKINRSIDSIATQEIEVFCKNSKNIKVIRGSSLEEIHNFPKTIENLGMEHEQFHVFLAIETSKYFLEQQQRYLGRSNAIEEDIETAKKIAKEVSANYGVNEIYPDTIKIIEEIARAGSYELHNLAALMGGIGSQEVVKLLTHQYSLLDNLVAFDGVMSKLQTWKL